MSYKVIGEALKKVFEKNMKTVKVTYDTGDVETTSVNGAMSDEEIKDYFKVGTEFNIGSVEDKMATVTDVEILGSDVNEYVEASGARVEPIFEDDDSTETIKIKIIDTDVGNCTVYYKIVNSKYKGEIICALYSGDDPTSETPLDRLDFHTISNRTDREPHSRINQDFVDRFEVIS